MPPYFAVGRKGSAVWKLVQEAGQEPEINEDGWN